MLLYTLPLINKTYHNFRDELGISINESHQTLLSAAFTKIRCTRKRNVAGRDQWGNIDVEGKPLLKMYMKTIGHERMDWMQMAKGRKCYRLLFMCEFYERLNNYQLDNNDSDA